jgi:sporulation protein YhbH
VVGRGANQGQGQGQDQAGDQAGEDYYETDVTLDELIEIMFEDLELPNMERKILRETMSERLSKRKGYRKAGIRIRLDKKRTAISRIKRKVATLQDAGGDEDAAAAGEEERFPFRKDDMTYRHLKEDVRPNSNAVVICIMDTSGSMDTTKKYLARSFFFLLYQFVSAKYHNVQLVFVAHHTEGKEVTEEEFFHKGESGGTLISSGYVKALEVIRDRYHPSLWNIYAFHCSDGDNFSTDNPAALAAAKELCEMCNLFGYGEIKPSGAVFYESSMIGLFRQLRADNFKAVTIAGKEFIWSSFREFLSRDRAGASVAAA